MNNKYVIGIDFGTDSCRALVVDTSNGHEISSGVSAYPRWKAGLYCNPRANFYRQHPLDYLESMTAAVRQALSGLTEDPESTVCGLCVDATGSTPALTDQMGMPLALKPEFHDDPDAMFVLWKDHTAIQEAEEITNLVKKNHLNYLLYEGGTYSSEWVWAKVWHIIRTNEEIKKASYAWVELCDWVTGVVTGNTIPETIYRSRCAAGHKAMWHESWGLPSKEFLAELNPQLKEMRPHLFSHTYTCNQRAGYLTAEWSERLGLSSGISVAVGAIDAHMGAVGASIAPGVLVSILGTSTCDIMVVSQDQIRNQHIDGICGQVDGSVIPGYIGIEAGQSAFGDIYAWFKKMLSWTLKDITDSKDKQQVVDKMLEELTAAAQTIAIGKDSPVALDWLNGRRSPYTNQHVKGILSGLTLSSTAPEIFRALVESTAYGFRHIIEHMAQQGLHFESVNAIGGISKKSPFVMQILSDVLNMPIRVVASEQTCALGAAMFAAVAADIYPDIQTAAAHMKSKIEMEYKPEANRALIYNSLYKKYLALANLSESLVNQ